MNEVREFPGRIARWVDGDTVRVDIDQGFYDWKLNRELRLADYDAPELRSKSQKERTFAIHVFEVMEELFPAGTEIRIISHHQKRGKYGRVIGTFATKDATQPDHTTWTAELISRGFVIPYSKYNEQEKLEIWETRHDLWQKESTDG